MDLKPLIYEEVVNSSSSGI